MWGYLVCVAGVAASSPAFAQRASLAAPSELETSRLDGFPGTFNAAMQREGEWRLDVGLTPSVSYGLHDDISLRTSLLEVAAWSSLEPGGSRRSRASGANRRGARSR